MSAQVIIHNYGYWAVPHEETKKRLTALFSCLSKDKFPFGTVAFIRGPHDYTTKTKDLFDIHADVEVLRNQIFAACGASYSYELEKDWLLVITGACHFGRKTTKEYALSFDGYEKECEVFKTVQQAAGLGKILSVPSQVPDGFVLVKDDKGNSIGLYHEKARILQLAPEFPIWSTTQGHAAANAVILYKIVTSLFDAYDGDDVAMLEKRLKDVEEKLLAKNIATSTENLYNNVFKRKSESEQIKNQLAQMMTNIDGYETQLVAWKQEARELSQRYEIAQVFEGLNAISLAKLNKSLETILRMEAVDHIEPFIYNGVPIGLDFILKPTSLCVVTAAPGHKDTRYFGNETWRLPKGKYVMGTYKIRVQQSGNSILVTLPRVSGTRHPHVSESNQPCYGVAMLTVINQMSLSGDLAYCVASAIEYLSQINEGHSTMSLQAVAEKCGWDYEEVIKDLKDEHGKSYHEHSAEIPFAKIRSDISSGDTTGGLSNYELMKHAFEQYNGAKCGRYMRVISEGGKEDTFVVLCGCGAKLALHVAQSEDFILGKDVGADIKKESKKAKKEAETHE